MNGALGMLAVTRPLIDSARCLSALTAPGMLARISVIFAMAAGDCFSMNSCTFANNSVIFSRRAVGLALMSRRNAAKGLSEVASEATSGILAFNFSAISIARAFRSPIEPDIALTAAMLGKSVASFPGDALISSSEGRETIDAYSLMRSGYPILSSSSCTRSPDKVRNSARLGSLLIIPAMSFGIAACSFSSGPSGRRPKSSLIFAGSAESVETSGRGTTLFNDATS